MRSEWDHLSSHDKARKLSRAGAPSLGTTINFAPDGEVLVATNTALEGYWQKSDETHAALADGVFHTGDGGYLDDEGYLVISDRKKDVIITGGENVSPIEVQGRGGAGTGLVWLPR